MQECVDFLPRKRKHSSIYRLNTRAFIISVDTVNEIQNFYPKFASAVQILMLIENYFRLRFEFNIRWVRYYLTFVIWAHKSFFKAAN